MTDPTARPQRADWRRNHERLLAVASTLVARDGDQVSLEEIARVAGVGSATLHRHFPSRRALLEEVFQGTVERLRARAGELADGDPRTGLVAWLEELAAAAADTRGLAASLAAGEGEGSGGADSCHDVMREATTLLLHRAHAASVVRPDVRPDDVLALVSAASLVTEGDPAATRRLLHLTLNGVWQ